MDLPYWMLTRRMMCEINSHKRLLILLLYLVVPVLVFSLIYPVPFQKYPVGFTGETTTIIQNTSKQITSPETLPIGTNSVPVRSALQKFLPILKFEQYQLCFADKGGASIEKDEKIVQIYMNWTITYNNYTNFTVYANGVSCTPIGTNQNFTYVWVFQGSIPVTNKEIRQGQQMQLHIAGGESYYTPDVITFLIILLVFILSWRISLDATISYVKYVFSST